MSHDCVGNPASLAELPHVIKVTVLGLTSLFGVPLSRGQSGPEMFFAVAHLAGLHRPALAAGPAGDLG